MQSLKLKLEIKKTFNFLLFTFNFWRSQKGFTLLELIIAMAIIAVLSGALWGNFFTSLTKGRDSRRKQDLEMIGKALELYYTDNKVYPTSLPAPGSSFTHPDNTSVIYMQKIPADPSYPNSSYCYPTPLPADVGSLYKLYANLENKNDPKIISPVSCAGVEYNYGISSANTSP